MSSVNDNQEQAGIDAQTVLEAYARILAEMTQRLVMAEARLAALEKKETNE